MDGSFDLLNQLTDFVVVESGSAAKWPSSHDETFNCGVLMLLPQAETEKTIHNLFEWTAGPSGFGFDPCRNVVIQCKCRSHIMMLSYRAS